MGGSGHDSTKGALLGAAAVAKVDNQPVIIFPDGSVMAVAMRTKFFVTRVPEAVLDSVPLGSDPLEEAIGLTQETTARIAKSVPRDTTFGGILEHAEIKANEDELDVEVTDGKRRHHIECKATRVPPEAMHLLESFGEGRAIASVAVNRKRLIAALDALEAACPGVEAFALLEVLEDGGIRITCKADRTGQGAQAIITTAKEKKKLPKRRRKSNT